MILIKSKESVVCDMKGCGNIAKYFIKKNQTENDFDSLKLCGDCTKKIFKTLSGEFKGKENKNV